MQVSSFATKADRATIPQDAAALLPLRRPQGKVRAPTSQRVCRSLAFKCCSISGPEGHSEPRRMEKGLFSCRLVPCLCPKQVGEST